MAFQAQALPESALARYRVCERLPLRGAQLAYRVEDPDADGAERLLRVWPASRQLRAAWHEELLAGREQQLALRLPGLTALYELAGALDPLRGERQLISVEDWYRPEDSLWRRVRAGALAASADEAMALAIRLADLAARLADAGRAHGQISPGQVVFCGGQPRLVHPLVAELLATPGSDGRERGLRLGALCRPPELAPEQEADPSTDCFAIGATMFVHLSGRVPRILATSGLRGADLGVPDLKRFRPELDDALVLIIGHCLAADPAQRYAGPRWLLEDLRALAGGRRAEHAERAPSSRLIRVELQSLASSARGGQRASSDPLRSLHRVVLLVLVVVAVAALIWLLQWLGS